MIRKCREKNKNKKGNARPEHDIYFVRLEALKKKTATAGRRKSLISFGRARSGPTATQCGQADKSDAKQSKRGGFGYRT